MKILRAQPSSLSRCSLRRIIGRVVPVVAATLAVRAAAVIGHRAAANTERPSVSSVADRFVERSSHRASFYIATPRILASKAKPNPPRPTGTPLGPNPSRTLDISTHFSEGGGLLPMWTYNIRAARDGHTYQGSIVGHDPFGKPGTDRIPTFIVPLVIRTHRRATSIDPTTGNLTLIDGDVTVDPTAPDSNCLTAPNNVPATVIQQSPVFMPARFVFGGTDVGTTQYLDAHQRASFWNVLGSRVNDYHVLLDPVRILDPVVLDVPPSEGTAIADQIFAPFGYTICTPVQAINYFWFQTYLSETVLPALSRQGVNAASLPVFLQYNSYSSVDVTTLAGGAAVGFHYFAGIPFGAQTYAVVDFDKSGLFIGPPDGFSTEVLTHEIGEWGNDPYGGNATPSWGNVGQVVGGCQSNLEVGDPLSGTILPNVTMPNGFSYRIQELAFFSWFYGPPSAAVNGWYSNNGTFTTDAGRACP
jgi:hypothetical protein